METSKSISLNEILRNSVCFFLPLFLIIAFEIVAINVYHTFPLNEHSTFFALWFLCQGISGIILGYISDNHCRKKILILIQVLSTLSLIWIFFNGINYYNFLCLSLFFIPSPIVRASLIDNFSRFSKVKILAISFVAQFIPWSIFDKLVKFDSNSIYFYVIIAMIFLLIFNLLFFSDQRDIHKNDIDFKKITKIKPTFILLAFLLVQIIFFITDTYFEKSVETQVFFTFLGFGSLVGAIVALFYSKTPHLSLLTVTYGIGIVLSSIPVFSSIFYPVYLECIPFQFMVFSNLGGFYLPFVYDTVISILGNNHRGLACGLIDGIISLASVIGLALVIFFSFDDKGISILTASLFIFATIFQRLSERKGRSTIKKSTINYINLLK